MFHSHIHLLPLMQQYSNKMRCRVLRVLCYFVYNMTSEKHFMNKFGPVCSASTVTLIVLNYYHSADLIIRIRPDLKEPSLSETVPFLHLLVPCFLNHLKDHYTNKGKSHSGHKYQNHISILACLLAAALIQLSYIQI